MVDIKGNLKPFRITKVDFIELVSQLIENISNLRYFKIDIERFSEECNDIDELRNFMDDLYLPVVVKNLTLSIYADPSIILNLSCTFPSYYIIHDAQNMERARVFENYIITFFSRHRTSRIFTWFSGFALAGVFLIALIIELAVFLEYVTTGTKISYFNIHLFILMMSITLITYITWSSVTSKPPTYSFNSSLLYMEEPITNPVWVFISTIIIEIFAAFIISAFI